MVADEGGVCSDELWKLEVGVASGLDSVAVDGDGVLG